MVGKAGLERKMEPVLCGVDGERRVEVDVKGKTMRILKTQDPQPGNTLTLTLQASLQQVAENAFNGQAEQPWYWTFTRRDPRHYQSTDLRSRPIRPGLDYQRMA